MNYSNSYPMDTVYPATGSAFRFEPEDTSIPIPFEPVVTGVPSYQIPTVSSEIEYSDVTENGGTVDPPIPTENENKKEMLHALRLMSIEYTEKELNNARQMRENLKHNSTISDEVRSKRSDIANTKIKQLEEKLEYLKSNEIDDSTLSDNASCSVS